MDALPLPLFNTAFPLVNTCALLKKTWKLLLPFKINSMPCGDIQNLNTYQDQYNYVKY